VRVEKPTLVTGGAGFVGTNVADRLLRGGHRVRILDNLSRAGVERNLQWLEAEHGDLLEVEVGDVCEPETLRAATRGVGSVFHFAAQVAVTTSLEEPLGDARVNLDGTLRLLEAARERRLPLIFTSTNKVYGSLDDVRVEEAGSRWQPVDAGLRAGGVAEDRPLSFCTPYGCSKGAADQYVLDYAASFGVPTAVFRMSCIYGPHQFGNEDQGWLAHFLISALDGDPITIYGDGKQVRDVLFVDDLVTALLLARERIADSAGKAFNIGGGPQNTVSLRELIDLIEELAGDRPSLAMEGWRQGDQRWYVSDTRRFGELTGWAPQTSPREGVAALYGWLVRERAGVLAEAAG
jgi:CDP-paratose 2-epimerase